MQTDTIILLVGLILLALLVATVRVRRSRRTLGRNLAEVPPALDTGEPSSPASTIPHYAAPPAPPEGPSLRVSLSALRHAGNGLLVGWTAVNDGSEPLAVQWGAPRLVPSAGDALQLRYYFEPSEDGDFEPPTSRRYEPGEIISRTYTITESELGRSPAGMRVTIALGYGPAAGFGAACEGTDAYLAWQCLATSLPRVVPKR